MWISFWNTAWLVLGYKNWQNYCVHWLEKNLEFVDLNSWFIIRWWNSVYPSNISYLFTIIYIQSLLKNGSTDFPFHMGLKLKYRVQHLKNKEQ